MSTQQRRGGCDFGLQVGDADVSEEMRVEFWFVLPPKQHDATLPRASH
jgi:hypothetical protein